ncbi:odorant receptor 46a-like [Hyposmocoma kahamanoa]|uniref:odorant receptor 46a-like n=1 Tax=Hyposmocoma kahamanoa TaxID=1477025 RepID=UPI000E6DA41E|nr:odorant receptor 46a-like [Hyposmocoma kahamanoa]
MAVINQTDCFNFNIKFWKFLGIWPSTSFGHYYKYYSRVFVMTFQIFYNLLFSLNFYYLPRQLDIFIEETIFYFTEIAVMSKVLTFFFMHDKIVEIFIKLQSDIFQPTNEYGVKVIENAVKFNVRYRKILAVVCFISSVALLLTPIIAHLLMSVELVLPVCSYSFLSEEIKKNFIYPIYCYQCFGMFFHMLYNMNIDIFFLGVLIFTIAQLDILAEKFRNITDGHRFEETDERNGNCRHIGNDDKELISRLNKAIVHYDEVSKFCELIQDTFSVTLFIQFSMASCIICICAFRFILPGSVQYYIFLVTYTSVRIIQIMVPCWFGNRIMDKSYELCHALYCCKWTSKSRIFKSSVRIFMVRACRPLTITGGKMFSLSLITFTSILQTAYSFFTLLCHMRNRL